MKIIARLNRKLFPHLWHLNNRSNKIQVIWYKQVSICFPPFFPFCQLRLSLLWL